MKKQYRQGDIYFIECDRIPEDAEEKENGIIAYGEVTGHAHRVRSPQMGTLMSIVQTAQIIGYLNAVEEMKIDHEEHNTITLPPGNWMAMRQREYTPDGWRQVED